MIFVAIAGCIVAAITIVGSFFVSMFRTLIRGGFRIFKGD